MTDRIQSMAIFGLMFAVLGYVIPVAVYTVVPAKYFYDVKQPVSIDKQIYKACDPIKLELERSSRVDVQAESLLELTLIYEGGEQDIAQRKKNINLSSGNTKIATEWKIPCNAPDGEYFISGIIHFKVQNAEKNYRFTTTNFNVTN